MLAVLLAVASSLSYGVSDFVGGLATRAAPVLRVCAVTLPVSLAVEAGLLLVLGARWPASALAWGAAAGVASSAAFALLYQSLALGPMGILSPVTAVVSAVLPAVVGLAEGERLSGAGGVGIVLAIVAVAAVSASAAERGRRPSPVALALAVGAGVAIAAQLICLSKTPHDSGVAPLVVCRAVSMVVLLAVAGSRHRRLAPAGPGTTRLAVASGLFDAAANVWFLLAVRSGSLVVVAVITALYPGSTVLLARRVLDERLTVTQLSGLLVAAVAVTLLAVS